MDKDSYRFNTAWKEWELISLLVRLEIDTNGYHVFNNTGWDKYNGYRFNTMSKNGYQFNNTAWDESDGYGLTWLVMTR